jgi:hypothetical protein
MTSQCHFCLLLVQELKWDLTPITCVSWVTVFLQTLCAGGAAKRDNLQFMTPQYSQHAFVQIMRVCYEYIILSLRVQ